MDLKVGKCYTVKKSDIYVKILAIKKKDADSTTALTALLHKSTNGLAENPTEYKLVHKYISDWEEYNA